MLKELREGQTLTVVEVRSEEITVEDDDGDYITFDIDPVGLPITYEGSESEGSESEI
jgi:hypothetical protein